MIHTQRLRLRPFTMSDLDGFVAYRKEPDVARYQSWSEEFTEEDGRAFIESVSSTPFGTPGAWVNLAIEHVSTKRLIGDVAHRREPDGTGAEIGFTLSTAAQGQGHATEAVGALCTLSLESVRTRLRNPKPLLANTTRAT